MESKINESISKILANQNALNLEIREKLYAMIMGILEEIQNAHAHTFKICYESLAAKISNTLAEQTGRSRIFIEVEIMDLSRTYGGLIISLLRHRLDDTYSICKYDDEDGSGIQFEPTNDTISRVFSF